MQIAIITDTHVGCKSDDQTLADIHYKFYNEVFFPTLRDRNISTVLHGGDLFDRRKYINFQTLQRFRKEIVAKSKEMGLMWHLIAGNHDLYYKNTSEVSSIRELLEDASNWRVYSDPKTVTIDGTAIALLPWINAENKERSMKYLKTTKAKILLGHLEIAGFEMNAGFECKDGLEKTLFENFDMVMSGHFHKRQSKGKLHYLGSPYDLSFADVDESRGFHILDTDTGKLEFIENPYHAFYKLIYNDVDNEYDFEQDDFSIYDKAYVKIVVIKKKKPSKFDELINRLYAAGVSNVSIIETELDITEVPKDKKLDMSQDTLSIIQAEAAACGLVEDPEKLTRILAEVYVEASNA